jgi:hypothetical protein
MAGYECVQLVKRLNGDLEVRLTEHGREELQAAGDDDEATLLSLLDYDLCNGWTLCEASELGALSNAGVLTDSAYFDDYGGFDVEGEWWYFEPYQVRSVVMELRAHGVAVFSKGY